MVLIQYCKSVTCEDFDFAFFWGHRLFWGQKLVRSKNDNKLIERYLDNLNFIIKKFSPEINHYSKKVNFYRANKYESPCSRNFSISHVYMHNSVTTVEKKHSDTLRGEYGWLKIHKKVKEKILALRPFLESKVKNSQNLIFKLNFQSHNWSNCSEKEISLMIID